MSQFINHISESLINDFENRMYISHYYESAINFFINLEFNFLSNETDYIYLPVFQSYSDLPYLFSKRFFFLLSNNKETLYKDIYIKNRSLMFYGNIEDKIKFLFDFLSFENELISKKDIKIFINNIILDLSLNFENDEKVMEAYINYIFNFSQNKDYINNEDFKNILINNDSGLYYIFFLYFYHYKKFNFDILNFLSNFINKQQKKNNQLTPTKSNLDSTTITNSDFQIELNDLSNSKQYNNTFKRISPLRKKSAFKTKKEITICKKIEENFGNIIENIFLKHKKNSIMNSKEELEKILKNNIEEPISSDNDSLDELNEFENEIVQIKTNSLQISEDKVTLIIESLNNSPQINSKNKIKRQNSFTSNNSKSIYTDFNEYECILVSFDDNKQIYFYYYILLQSCLFLFTNKKIIFIPFKRLFLNEQYNVKIKNNEFHTIEFTSIITEFSFIFYFDEKFKITLFNHNYSTKHNNTLLESKYEIYKDKKIGKGTFSKVYLCKQYKNNQIYCIKEINRDFNNETPYIFNKNILNKEIDISEHILKKINNSSIIHCEDIFETKDKVYIIFTYYNQGNLLDFFQQVYPQFKINNEKIFLIDKIIKQLISTFNYLEKFGITHRDLKPENILVTYTSKTNVNIHLIDFGFADIGLYNQQMDACIGTLVFTAPEIILNNHYFRNVDTWSIGILIFYLLFDFLPFDIVNDEDDLNSVKQKILNNNFHFPYNHFNKNEYDIKIRKFILKCLEKDKNKRPRISEIKYK